ncbi:DNA polymerase V [Azospirillum agricola]|uniref:LexA family protein n=1 Tax=Azospirillum agricola TaxID=1720247 RepID=UPI001AE7110D|nr:translesion error-prone DNA polymerase V autoproteolytic subunit [Azospirillum agricola]MBP2232459.1 DNA polymerase V [Azospirillum agricola]
MPALTNVGFELHLEPVEMSVCEIWMVEANVPAGFPSPAADYVEGRLDLSEILVPHPSATFTLRISGHSMSRAGIHDGDLALVDRSLTARHDDVVVAVLDGELTCKRLLLRSGRTYLAPDSDDRAYQAVDVTGRPGFEIWGVIYSTIRFHRR